MILAQGYLLNFEQFKFRHGDAFNGISDLEEMFFGKDRYFEKIPVKLAAKLKERGLNEEACQYITEK